MHRIRTLLCTGLLAIAAVACVTDSGVDPDALESVLAGQADDVRARYVHRHPDETLTFFEVAPGETVVEVLPGGGWYSRILLSYLGPQGHLIGADYAFPMIESLGFFSGERLEARRGWPEQFVQDAAGWNSASPARLSAYTLATLPASLDGSVDTVLFVRALHNLARKEEEGGYLSDALATAYRLLEPGGVVGVVQHEAQPEASDAWAAGSNGYLKRAFVIDRMERAGFVLEASSEVNANPKDRPTEEERVWRLPPAYAGSGDDEAKRAAVDAIGESNRMTLRFRKPE